MLRLHSFRIVFFLVEFDRLDLEIFVICWIGSVDPVDDLCLRNQIYSALLNAFEFKEITEVEKCSPSNASMMKRAIVVTSTRHHLVRLLKYYPRRPCAPSFDQIETFFAYYKFTYSTRGESSGASSFWPRGQNPTGAITL